MQPNDPDADPYETTGSMLAHLYHQHGAKRIHQAMTTWVEAGTIPKQFAAVVAAELRAARLPKVAEIVESYIDQCPDGLDLRYCSYCYEKPYVDSPGNQANIDAWCRRRTRLMATLNEMRDKWLRLAEIGTE
jgi:hypothetical protein